MICLTHQNWKRLFWKCPYFYHFSLSLSGCNSPLKFYFQKLVLRGKFVFTYSWFSSTQKMTVSWIYFLSFIYCLRTKCNAIYCTILFIIPYSALSLLWIWCWLLICTILVGSRISTLSRVSLCQLTKVPFVA